MTDTYIKKLLKLGKQLNTAMIKHSRGELTDDGFYYRIEQLIGYISALEDKG